MKIDLLNKLKKEDEINGYGFLFKDTRKIYLSILLIIIFGFAFFLSSNSWMPRNMINTSSLLGEKIDLNSQLSVTLKRWEYNTKENFFEVELANANSYINEDFSFTVDFYTDKERHIPLDIVFNSDDFMVLQADKIPNAKTIRLDVTLTYLESGKQKQSTVSFFSEIETGIINDNLPAQRTDIEYLIASYENDLNLKQKQKEQNSYLVESLKKEINEYNQKVSELENVLETKTNDEKENIQVKISTYNSMIEKNKNEILRLEEDNHSMTKDIERLQKQLENQ